MLFLFASVVRVVLQTAIGAYVATRAWAYRPAKLFLAVVGSLLLLSVSTHLVDSAGASLSPAAAGLMAALLAIGLGLFQISSLLIFSSMALPQWWEGRRPTILWVSLPYLICFAALLVDVITPLDLLFGAPQVAAGAASLKLARPGGIVFLSLYLIGWLVQIAILIAGAVQRPRLRTLLIVMLVSLLVSVFLGRFLSGLGVVGQYIGLVQTLPLLAALAFAVLRGQQFEAKRVALDLALESLGEAVAVLDRKGEALYANPRAGMLGLELGGALRGGLERAGVAPDDIARLEELVGAAASAKELLLAVGSPTRLIAVELATVADADREAQGTLLLARDVTETEQRAALLARERARLAETVSQLQAEQLQRSELAATLQSLSLPVIPVLEGVLVLPVIGSFDAERTGEFLSVLLRGIERERARLVLIDVTGMTLLDPAGAQGLLRGVRASELLGARCVLVGVRPELAQSLVGLNAPLAGLQTAATLQQAVRQELMRQV